jgi:hypothetical protein
MVRGGTPKTIAFGGQELKFVGEGGPEIDDGIEITRESNADKTARKLFKYNPWSATGCVVEADLDLYTIVKEIHESGDDVDVTIEMADGDVLVGVGGPEGTIKFSPEKATMSFDVAGGGVLKKL